MASVLLALLLMGRPRDNRSGGKNIGPAAILDDIVSLVALASFTFVSSFGFAAGAMMSSGDLRSFAVAVTFAMSGVSALALTRLGFRPAASSRSVADDASRRYPVANDH